jgi:type VI secretion system protein ImpH
LENLAPKDWSEGNYLERVISKEAYKFEFYQAVRLIDLLYKKYIKALGKDFDKDVQGEIFDEELKGIRFKSNIDPSFPASDLERIKVPGYAGDSFEMTVNFMGLAGATGPMPAHYTQMILDIEKESGSVNAFREFLDIFNHRLISLIYQVRKKHRVGFQSKPPEETSISNYFYSLIGMGTEGLRKRLSINDSALLNYIGLFVNRNRSVAGLEFILSDYFDVKVKSKSFIGQWQKVDGEFVTVLGVDGRNQTLGSSAMLGNQVWDQEAKFDLRIGPVSGDQYLDFLPIYDSKSFLPLIELTRHYAGPEYEFDFTFTVKPDELPRAVLGDRRTAKLGWTTWIPPESGGIFNNDFLVFVENGSNEEMILDDGKKVRLGGSVWVPDIETGVQYVEIKIDSNDLYTKG